MIGATGALTTWHLLLLLMLERVGHPRHGGVHVHAHGGHGAHAVLGHAVSAAGVARRG